MRLTKRESKVSDSEVSDMIREENNRDIHIAKVPPSPSSFAARTIKTYLMVTIKVKVQMIRDSAPRRSCFDGSDEKVEEYT